MMIPSSSYIKQREGVWEKRENHWFFGSVNVIGAHTRTILKDSSLTRPLASPFHSVWDMHTRVRSFSTNFLSCTAQIRETRYPNSSFSVVGKWLWGHERMKPSYKLIWRVLCVKDTLTLNRNKADRRLGVILFLLVIASGEWDEFSVSTYDRKLECTPASLVYHRLWRINYWSKK